MSQFRIDPGSLGPTLDKTFARLGQLRFADALWERDVAMWTADVAVREKIAQRLGWLDAIPFVRSQLDRVRAFADEVSSAGFTDVVLLGMGGSSLAPEVLRQVIGVAGERPRFRMLDSVDPEAVRAAMSRAATSLFIFASKSGGTIEPNAMAAEARRRVESAGFSDWGARFAAITDEGTALHRLATSERFRQIFVNPADIGGRYSALSLFGMVPAALMGVDVNALLDEAAAMAEACRLADPRQNPGLALGAVMAAAALEGRDKLTLLLPPRLSALGLWIEQLVAESTGKLGKGVVPIAGEHAAAPVHGDRLGVTVRMAGAVPDAAARERLVAGGAPVLDIDMPGPLSLGAEFFRWEVATAAAGRLLDINPFDEPNVQQAKDATRVLLEHFARDGRLPTTDADQADGGAMLTLSSAAREKLGGAPAARFVETAGAGDYVAILAYLPPDAEPAAQQLDRFRVRLAERTGCATMLGYGPRYLHSTGQLHKGGANNGVFIVLSVPPHDDLPVPGQSYSFGILEGAQAIGDFQSLDRTRRRAVLVQIPSRDGAMLDRTLSLLSD